MIRYSPGARYRDELGMTSGNQQGEERKLRRGLLEQRCEQVGFQVVHRNGGDIPAPGEAPPHRGSDEERADESGARGIGNAVNLGRLPPGRREGVADQGEQPANVVAGRDLRHDAAVLRVQGDLGMQLVRHEAEAPVVQGHTGFVARGFDAEHQHGTGRRRGWVDGDYASLYATWRAAL